MRMSRYSRGRSRSRQSGDRNSFWLSFSDLMSALVLVIILVLFYILYQYFLMYDDYEARRDQMVILQASLEQSEEDIAAQEAALAAAQSELDEKNNALTTAQDELTAAQDELTSAQDELTAAQEDLAVQQMLLEAAQRAADQTQEELDAREEELQTTLAQLEQQQAQLNEQQSQISSQQSQLEQQQRQIEDLVGIRTQIISDLSSALRAANISATVDPASGATPWPATCCLIRRIGTFQRRPRAHRRLPAGIPGRALLRRVPALYQRNHYRGPYGTPWAAISTICSCRSNAPITWPAMCSPTVIPIFPMKCAPTCARCPLPTAALSAT